MSIVNLVKPFLSVLVAQAVPYCIQFLYGTLAHCGEALVGSLKTLKLKISSTTDPTKKAIHETCFNAGISALTALGQAFVDAAEELKA